MSAQNNLAQVNVLVVIDTAYTVKNYPNPSTDPEDPTAVDDNSQYMICSGRSRGIVGEQGAADLELSANAGDVASFTGISISGNTDAAVILYGIRPREGEKVFNLSDQKKVASRRSVMPDPTKPNGLPPTHHHSISYAQHKVMIGQAGKGSFYVDFAVYILAKDGQTQKLYGYFSWNPSVTVRGDIPADTESK